MRKPVIWRASTIKKWDNMKEVKTRFDPIWVPVRPFPHPDTPWWGRFRLAWLVFTGKMDALWWED